ncbi:DUF5753 domain-containing protein [Amycolatopsis sp.]|uniref:DUF5753 domain-containing protein n=1 Tax=Amycolatopsis sp. TaxID=37632 RepID=UPI002619522D|nr:DUF5753 domain-containing protein [Amycolatopsis sp.]
MDDREPTIRSRELGGNVANVPSSEVEERVAARLARQSLFSRSPHPQFTFFLHEFVLRLPVGGVDVMSDQLHHLLRMSVRQYISIRVVPATLGAHAGISGHFALIESADFGPVVYLDSETSSLFLEEKPEIQAYRRVLNALAATALPEGQSVDLIATTATELYPVGEDPDDHI